jgi:hypothetical protein
LSAGFGDSLAQPAAKLAITANSSGRLTIINSVE